MKVFKLLLKNNSGMALLMVISAVALMTIVLADLTFETQLNKIKIYNLQDRSKAKLNAEAGINFALAKLKLYQQAINLINKEKNLKDIIKPSTLESVVTSPFIFPIPEIATMTLSQKQAVKDFMEDNVLQGSLRIDMRAVSGFLNPNNMRIVKKSNQNNNPDDPPDQTQNDVDKLKKSPQKYIEDKLIERLESILQSQRENDDVFNSKYSNLDANLLVKELKYFVSDPGDFDDPELGEIENLYDQADVKAKRAPMTSIDEMYMLQGWPDEVIDLVIGDLSVHEVSIIQVNNINQDQLKIIFPDITEVQIEEFFKYRDGDPERQEDPKPFKDEDEFQNVVTNYLGIVSKQQYEERMKELASAGLNIGVAGKLFRIESIGEFERATFKYVAYIDLPIKPNPPPPKKKNEGTTKSGDNENNGNDNGGDGQTDNPDDKNQEKEPPPREYLEPRVIEVRLN